MDIKIRIGNRIKFLREDIGYTQKELATKLGLKGETAVANYEAGYSIPKDDIKFKMCEIFTCSLDYLLCKTDIRNAVVNVNKIPILGTVKAGYNWLAEENIVDYITIKENMPNIKEYFALRITRSINVAASI